MGLAYPRRDEPTDTLADPAPETDDFAAFCLAQRRRVRFAVRTMGTRIDRRRKASQEIAHESWETRGRVAGYCGLRRGPVDVDED